MCGNSAISSFLLLIRPNAPLTKTLSFLFRMISSLLTRRTSSKQQNENYEFARSLVKKYCLLLTATPIQNRIEEIFNLVSLLKPGHLGNESGFQETFNQKDGIDAHEHLKELVNKVMIRNTRSDTGLTWTKRHVETVPITFSPTEQALYDDIAALKTARKARKRIFHYDAAKRVLFKQGSRVYDAQKMLDQRQTSARIR